MKAINKLLILLIFFIQFQLKAETICQEPSDGINKFHLVYLGAPAGDLYKKNLNGLCNLVDKYLKTNNDEKFKIFVWTDETSQQIFSNQASCNAGNFDFEVRNVSSLLDNQSIKDKSLYEYYLGKKNYAPATDYIRLLAVNNHGGCYMDIGRTIRKEDFLFKDLQKKDNDPEKYYVLERGSYEPEDLRITEKAGPILQFFNSFFAARKGHKIFDALLNEFSFKHDFFIEHRHIIDLLYDHCSTFDVVMSLTGQFAYNDLYRSLARDKNPLFNNIVPIDLSGSWPYPQKVSWLKKNPDDCGLVIAALYNDFRDKKLDDKFSNLVIDKEILMPVDNLRPLDIYTAYYGIQLGLIPQDKIKLQVGILTGDRNNQLYDPTTVGARRILNELMRFYRAKKTHPALKNLTETYLTDLKKGIKAQKNIGTKQLENNDDICIKELSTHFPNRKIQKTNYDFFRSVPVILRASLIKELKIPLHLDLYDRTISSEFDLNNPEEVYFGHLIWGCGAALGDFYSGKGEENFPLFIPLYKITSDIGDKITKRQKN